jgi:hypothetical protein
MSKIKVNSIEAATGSTITIPSGQTLDISSTTLTLPSTVVTTTGTQTLTNKTIGVSQLSGTLPVANGGTGLTTLGSASQVLRVNSGATALEFAALASGILQVKRTIFTGTASVSITTAGTFYQIPTDDFSVNITPQFSNSVILLLGMVRHSVTTSGIHRMRIGLFRDSTQIGLNTNSVGNRVSTISASYITEENQEMNSGNLIYIDSPNTTSAINYNFKMTSNANSQTGYINRAYDDGDNSGIPRGVSSIIAIEIANGIL